MCDCCEQTARWSVCITTPRYTEFLRLCDDLEARHGDALAKSPLT